MKAGEFITDIVVVSQAVAEEVYVVTEAFIIEIYKFMLPSYKQDLRQNPKIRDLSKYFSEKLRYESYGCLFDEDVVECFVEQHKI